MPTAPRMNKPQGGYDFWADTLQPGLFGLYDRWTERNGEDLRGLLGR